MSLPNDAPAGPAATNAPVQAPGRGGAGVRRLPLLLSEASPIDLRLVGRTLLHAALVGAAAGLAASMFFAALELVERALLGHAAGYVALRARGERILPEMGERVFRPWLLLFLPALGGLLAGLVSTRFAPETRGGGGDAMIEAFHGSGGNIRGRVAWVKMLASVLTLGTGGSGGREGPTMQIGGSFGCTVARVLRVSPRERRILMIAGVAAGMAAIFRTPLGAALLAVEVLYRDDFESDALIPALLASVVAYSVFISIFGESTLFAHAERFPFVPSHLPLYALLAVFVALVGAAFLYLLRRVQAVSLRLPGPTWARPAAGGLALGALVVPVLLLARTRLQGSGFGYGILGGGYGAAQVAITGAPWLPGGWTGVELLLGLCAAKLVASSLTIGSGGSAGDFAPSLAIGGILGGAFGRAAQLVVGDPRIDPGAFALVGMGTFYGGIAHVPVASLVMVCELAGSYDLLVPLMLAEGVAFVALRRRSLYASQPRSKRDSRAHHESLHDLLRDLPVRAVMVVGRPYTSFQPATPLREVSRGVSEATWQDVFPVLDTAGRMTGMITADVLRVLAVEHDLDFAVAADAMNPAAAVRPGDDLRTAALIMQAQGLRELPVVGDDGRIVGFVDEAEIARAYLDATAQADRDADSLRPGT